MIQLLKTTLIKYVYYIAGAIALAILYGACYLTYVVTDSRWQSEYETLKGTYASASAKATQEARAKEQQYEKDKQTLLLENQKQLEQAKADADSANAAIDRMRQRINKLLADTSSTDTGTSTRGKTANEALVLLTNVLEKSVERNRQLASFADTAYNSGSLCEKSYDALQSK